MNENDESLRLWREPTFRRCWLLAKALECCPLDRALELANAAEAFLTGQPVEGLAHDVGLPPEPATDVPRRAGAAPQADTTPPDPVAGEPPGLTRPKPQKCQGLGLSPERREQLLERLAGGARNAELASEFGLSAQQVQGIRIGSARDIARRRERHSEQQSAREPEALASTPVEEVVRYLRQQDDVVVPQDNGEFLVNARFRMGLPQLVERANRMRGRQGKPLFEVATSQPPSSARIGAANGHSLFWDAAAKSDERQSVPAPAI